VILNEWKRTILGKDEIPNLAGYCQAPLKLIQ